MGVQNDEGGFSVRIWMGSWEMVKGGQTAAPIGSSDVRTVTGSTIYTVHAVYNRILTMLSTIVRVVQYQIIVAHHQW